MHRLEQAELNFSCYSEQMAQWFQDCGERLFVDELLPVACEVLDEFEQEQQLTLPYISVQLPPLRLPADRYLMQHSFREALRHQLWQLLPPGRQQSGKVIALLSRAQRQQLIDDLRQARTSALQQHWALYLKHSKELVQILRQLAGSGDLCTVLAFGLSDSMLEALTAVLAPVDQPFIVQLLQQPQLFMLPRQHDDSVPRLPAPPALWQRQRHLWQLSLSYLLTDRGSQFNRRSYLYFLLRQMAAHDNLSLQNLVQHMLHTLLLSQQAFARHSPLLQQLSLLLAGIAELPPEISDIARNETVPGYFSQRIRLDTAVLPQITATGRGRAVTPLLKRWQRWQQLLLQRQLTLAQQRQFNVLLQQLLQQPGSLWLDSLRQQLQSSSLLSSLIDYASDDNLQLLFQHLQPAGFASLTPYTGLLKWGLEGISLPQPFYRQILWQSLLGSGLQRQPVTLAMLLLQLQLWLQSTAGEGRSRQLLQQLIQQLTFYNGNTVRTRHAELLQQLQWQLAVTTPWTSHSQQPVLQQQVVGSAPAAVAVPDTVLPETVSASVLVWSGADSDNWLELSEQLVKILPLQVQQQGRELCQQVWQQLVFHPPVTASAANAGKVLAGSYLFTSLAALAAAGNPGPFYRQLAITLHQNAGRNRLAALLLQQLRQVIRLVAAGKVPAITVVTPSSAAKATPAQLTAQPEPTTSNDSHPQRLTDAGLVLAAPYLPLLWQRLGWVKQQAFVSVTQAWQACALLHYMARHQYDSALPPNYWQCWQLNMLLCGVTPPVPAGWQPELTPPQLELADSLLAGILAQWPKLANSSVATLQECFLQRSGSLFQAANSSGWQLQLDSGPYDMLLDGLPWSYSLIRYPWMQGELYVHWRG